MPRRRKGPDDPGPILLPFLAPEDGPDIRLGDVPIIDGQPHQLTVCIWDDEGRFTVTLTNLVTGVACPMATPEQIAEWRRPFLEESASAPSLRKGPDHVHETPPAGIGPAALPRGHRPHPGRRDVRPIRPA